MSYTYASFQIALALEMVIPNANVNDPNFVLILPTLIDEAEQRCYRDLDLLSATTAQTAALTPLNRKLDLTAAPSLSQILILETVSVITPAGTTDPDAGVRNPLYPRSKEWLDAVHNSIATAGLPRYFAMLDDKTVLLGPFPDSGYTAEIVGKFRPAPLYANDPGDGSQTTFLASVLPDVLLAAAMVSASGYRHNFGAQADDPRMALSWEQRYQANMTSAKNEETRKKFHGWQQGSSQSTPAQNT